MAQILIRSTDELKEAYRKEAKRIGLTLNALLLQILREYGEQKGFID